MKLIRIKPEVNHWSPFDRMASFRDLLDSAFQLAASGEVAASRREWAPLIDVYEDADKVTVRFELAGMKKEDFDISLHDDNLTVSGDRKLEERAGEGESFRSERFHGSFSRTLQLPAQVQPDRVEATYTDGILEIQLPKAEEAKPRRIEVSVR